MNKDRTVVDDTPDLSRWDLQDEELDRASPARAGCVSTMGGCIVCGPCRGGGRQ
jgi:hypothetical protein